MKLKIPKTEVAKKCQISKRRLKKPFGFAAPAAVKTTRTQVFAQTAVLEIR